LSVKPLLRKLISVTVFLLVSMIALFWILRYSEDQKFSRQFKAKVEPLIGLLTDESGKLLLKESEIIDTLQKSSCLREENIHQIGNVKLYLPHCEFQGRDTTIFAIFADSKGYGGWIKVLALFERQKDRTMKLWKVKVLDARDETEGLGKNVLSDEFQKRFYNVPESGLEKGLKLDLEEFPPTFDAEEAKKEGFILVADIMSYATVSAKAVANAIQVMYNYLKNLN